MKLKTIKQKIVQSALGLSLLLSPLTADAAASLEVLVSDKPKIDVTLYASIDRFGIFHRSRVLDNYSLTAVNYDIMGIKVLAGVQASIDKLIPKLGVMYANKFGNLNLSSIMTVGYDENPNFTGTVNVCYKPNLTKNLNGIIGAELISSFNLDGHLFSTQRMRLGLEYEGNEVGLATDLVELGDGPKLSTNPGVFLKKTF